ncbi:hypothetical protein BEN74_05385 [Acinetobacter sp. WCHAc010034]|nr:hypothetical protein BEN74_05385 [Acinetobacter sp. WCHAc010034]
MHLTLKSRYKRLFYFQADCPAEYSVQNAAPFCLLTAARLMRGLIYPCCGWQLRLIPALPAGSSLILHGAFWLESAHFSAIKSGRKSPLSSNPSIYSRFAPFGA